MMIKIMTTFFLFETEQFTTFHALKIGGGQKEANIFSAQVSEIKLLNQDIMCRYYLHIFARLILRENRLPSVSLFPFFLFFGIFHMKTR